MRLFLCAALAAASQSSSAQDTAAAGFALAPAPYPGASPFAASTTLSNGDIVVFDGLQVAQYAADGSPLVTLGSLTAPAFASFIVADSDEQVVFLGESSNGHLYRLVLGLSSNPELLTTLPFNYDAAQFESDALFVSAATCGFGCGSEIWRVDLGSYQTTLVAQVPGASGPIAFDRAGALLYGSVSDQFPPPPESSAVWRWSASQLVGPAILDLDDAQLVAGGFAGAARLAYDRRQDALFLIENNFATGENRILRVLSSAAQSPVLVEGRPFWSMGNPSFLPGQGVARFRAHQPASGGWVTFTTTDFVTPAERFEVRPLRPAASLTGVGPGQLELALENGPPSGFARILVGPRAGLPGSERPFVLAGLPLFLGLDQRTQSSVPGLFPLDPAGGLQLGFPDPGEIGGSLALQLYLLDAGQRPAGTSTVALL